MNLSKNDPDVNNEKIIKNRKDILNKLFLTNDIQYAKNLLRKLINKDTDILEKSSILFL